MPATNGALVSQSSSRGMGWPASGGKETQPPPGLSVRGRWLSHSRKGRGSARKASAWARCEPSCEPGCEPSCELGCEPSCTLRYDPGCEAGCVPPPGGGVAAGSSSGWAAATQARMARLSSRRSCDASAVSAGGGAAHTASSQTATAEAGGTAGSCSSTARGRHTSWRRAEDETHSRWPRLTSASVSAASAAAAAETAGRAAVEGGLGGGVRLDGCGGGLPVGTEAHLVSGGAARQTARKDGTRALPTGSSGISLATPRT
eukprot:scaffold11417_cov90-Isochrysis_galbana.AAC.3